MIVTQARSRSGLRAELMDRRFSINMTAEFLLSADRLVGHDY
jgi:hypothetical protein